jgi:predicted extracellular nuclease
MRDRRNNIIKVGSFNLLNLALPEVPYYNRRGYTHEEFAKKKTWINLQLDNMDADIVGVQEVFQEEALRNVLNANPNFKDYYTVVADNGGSGSPSVGLISRFPISDYEVIRSFRETIDVEGVLIPFDTFSRPVLKAKVRISPTVQLTIFVVHLKSKRPIFPDDQQVSRDNPLELAKGQARALLRRTAEANALRTILIESLMGRDTPVIVMGDLNDTHTSVTTQLISGEPPYRHLPFEAKLKAWDVLLYHVKDIQARKSYVDTYYTHIHNGHYESLDHIMVSQELVSENPKHVGRVGVVRTFNDHLVDETLSDERVLPWTSDHAQVVASIEFNDPIF